MPRPCPACEQNRADIARLNRFALQIAERLYLCAEVLSIRAERRPARQLARGPGIYGRANMDQDQKLKIKGKILLCANALELRGLASFDEETLAVECFRTYPETFSLDGYVGQHVNVKTVSAAVCGQRGMIRMGLLAKLAEKRYSLTHAGHERVRLLTVKQTGRAAEPVPELTREQVALIRRLRKSAAAKKLDGQRKEELTFSDACQFWGITTMHGEEQIDEQIGAVRDALLELARLVGDDKAERNGDTVTAGDVCVLSNTHRFLEERYAKHLDLIRRRAGQKAGKG